MIPPSATDRHMDRAACTKTGRSWGVQPLGEGYPVDVKADNGSPLTGSRAPIFTLPRTRYQAFSLRDTQGYPTILVFYPGDWEPVSAEQLRLYQEYLPALGRFNASLVGISVDSVWSHAAFGKELGLSFPLLSDSRPKGHVSRAYDVYREAEDRSDRALFVIDPEGVVRWSRTFPFNLNPGIDGILRALQTPDRGTAALEAS